MAIPRIETILMGMIAFLVLCLVGLSINAMLHKTPKPEVEALAKSHKGTTVKRVKTITIHPEEAPGKPDGER
ncbi:MAG: hypothetical protein R3D02_16710 [Hyphomicrobiales bacterium]